MYAQTHKWSENTNTHENCNLLCLRSRSSRHTHVRTYVHTHVRTYVCSHLHLQFSLQRQTYVTTHTNTHTRTHTYVHMHTHLQLALPARSSSRPTHTHANTNTHTHTHTHTHTNAHAACVYSANFYKYRVVPGHRNRRNDPASEFLSIHWWSQHPACQRCFYQPLRNCHPSQQVSTLPVETLPL